MPRTIEEAPAPLGRPAGLEFRDRQLGFPRVRTAWDARAARVQALFAAQDLDPTRVEVYLRAFKRERVLEVWARESGSGPFARLAVYPICVVSGVLGPKRRQGDEQVPEGFYRVSAFNPWSAYHLSLELDYPNRADRLRERAGAQLGGDIFIHGDCRTVGCLPMTDEGIEEIYWIAVLARSSGQAQIPVHIFPARMEGESLDALHRAVAGNPALRAFWDELQPAYEYFQALRRVPDVATSDEGRYEVPRPIGFPVGALEESWRFLPGG